MNIQFNTAPPLPSRSKEALPVAARPAPETAPPAPQSQAPPAGQDTLKQVARQINDFLQASKADIEFSVDGESKEVVVRIIDSETRKTIRQIPSEEMLAISKSLDRMTGLLIKQTA